jgi:DNA-binding GntR family transcriptional regulator
VARLSLRDIEEIYQVRSALNGLMMELFVANASAEDIAAARAVHDRMRAAGAAGDAEGFFAERVRLHDIWMERCGNATLRRALAQWLGRMSLKRLGVARPEQIERSLLDHERLMIACEERDATLAAALIRSMALTGLDAIRRAGLPGLGDEGAEAPQT